MMNHGNVDELVDYNDHSVSSRKTKNRPMTVVDRPPTRSWTNEDGEDNVHTLRQENEVPESNHADADMPISDRIDVFMNALVAHEYATP